MYVCMCSGGTGGVEKHLYFQMTFIQRCETQEMTGVRKLIKENVEGGGGR